jgi:excisionase family DNA binding protein
MRLLTVPEAAERLGLKPATLRFWLWTRKIESVKVGRAVRLREDTIQQLIERGTVPARRG